MNVVPAMLRINANPRWRGKVGHVADDGFWLAIGKRHPQGERLSREIELGLQAITRSGRKAALRDLLRRDVGH